MTGLNHTAHTLAVYASRSRLPDALAKNPGCAAGHRVLGALAVLLGDHDSGLAHLEDALASDARDSEAHVWRAHARRALGFSGKDVLRDLDLAASHSDGYAFAAFLVRAQASILSLDDEQQRSMALDILPGLSAFRADGAAIVERRDDATWRALVDDVLNRMAGNRSEIVTEVVEGELVRVVTPPGPRYAAHLALELIAAHPPDRVRRALETVRERHPGSSLPICYLGEFHLWLGDLDAARRYLEEAIEHTRRTRWAYIGLSACAILEGDPGGALDVLAHGIAVMQNTTGPAVYVHRGEALRRLGRFVEARRDLEHAAALAPQRLSAWINLGLLQAAVGDAQGLTASFTELRARASGLLSDAAAELGLVIWSVGDELPPIKAQQAILAHALPMLRGNRSSTLTTYFTRDGTLRSVRADAGTFSAHEEAKHLDRVDSLLSRTLAAWSARIG